MPTGSTASASAAHSDETAAEPESGVPAVGHATTIEHNTPQRSLQRSASADALHALSGLDHGLSAGGDEQSESFFSRVLCLPVGRRLVESWRTLAEMIGWKEPEEEEPFTIDLLSSRQLRQLRWAFNVLDEDGSGFIQGHELEQVVQLLGDNPSRSEAKDLLKWLDTDNDGQVSFEEFAHAWWQRPVGLMEAAEQQEELELAFRMFDSNQVLCRVGGRVGA